MRKTVLQMMSSDPLSIAPEASAQQASEMLADCCIGALIVAGQNGMIGILSERDVVTKVSACGLSSSEVPVQDIMTSIVNAVPGNTDPYEALTLMLYEQIRHLPVIGDNGQVIGMLNIRDLLKNMLEQGCLI